ncbi:MAG: efflux RND transporter permease subunit [Prolixibacteraceae bacterium]|jgi:multidrug efflux pump subunit AcrB|nr:efflux RND transporter permease subunit [Prolixibacteraceae bacterium]
MINFLIRRPIAVTMSFIAILVLGVFAMNFIPVSLMPDIDIPEITVQVSDANTTARELENTVVQPIRRQLMQVAHLADITSECRNENGVIHLKFEYGTSIDYAFIEVNEKIDRAMNNLPRNILRPKVIKANATDIPVFYLNLTLKSSNPQNISNGEASNPQTAQPSNSAASNISNGEATNRAAPNGEASGLYPVSQQFVNLSRFATNVISKRIEQLPEVAMVDISGTVSPELLILPDNQKLESLGITLTTLENSIRNSNIKLGNLLIRDGQYQYSIRFSSTLQNKKDIENVYFKVKERLLQLKDVATVIEHPQKQKGMVLHNGKDAVVFAVIKQSDARMSELKSKLNDLIGRFEKDYPDIRFDITRNQTTLLDFSIGNLYQDLLWGALLAFIVMFLFMKDYRAPWLVGITIPTSLVVSMLFFYILHISMNIVSLSGIILGVGMTVDNSIIVIDNITQHRKRILQQKQAQAYATEKLSNPQTTETQSTTETTETKRASLSILDSACASGTNEIFAPLLSSALTNCAVFIPLIFISGIAGAMFYDQAMAVTIGLLVSLGVSVTILPVYYRLIYRSKEGASQLKFMKRINLLNFEVLYMSGFRFVMRNQVLATVLVIACLAGSCIMYPFLEKTRLPAIEKDELMLAVDWNEHIHVSENKRRTLQLIDHLQGQLEQNTCMVGEQKFVMDKNSVASSAEALIYLKIKRPSQLDSTQRAVEVYLRKNFPRSIVQEREVDNIFNMIFSSDERPLTARLRAVNDYGPNKVAYLQNTLNKIRSALPGQPIEGIPLSEYTILHTDPVKLMLYDVSFDDVYGRLKSAFNENQVFLISDNQDFVPVVVGGKASDIRSVINELFIRSKKNELIPVRDLVSESKGEDLKLIVAGKEGEYFPVNFDIAPEKLGEITEKVGTVVRQERLFEVGFSGNIFSNKALMKELTIILLIGFALLYFILTSQFESLTLPLLVLLEVPIDIFGAFIALKLGGTGINLMSLIGIVVMSGIVINDSILKVDTMNKLYNEGMPLMRAIVESGHRRLLSIIMTSLTAILALLPILFTPGLGADLQKPLALAVIGSMILGTLVSLYFVPLCFYYLKKGDKV